MEESPSIRSFALGMKDSIKRFQVERISEKGREAGETSIIVERPVTFFLNDQEVVTLLDTPENLRELAAGFMLSEGWLREDKSIDRIQVDPQGDVRVWVKYRNPLTEKLFLRRTILSGCGRGTIFYNVLDSLSQENLLLGEDLAEMVKAMKLRKSFSRLRSRRRKKWMLLEGVS